jgi:DNA-binding NarL/FixJ family response regulator
MSRRVIRLMLIDDHDMVVQSLRAVLALEDDIEVVASANSIAEGVMGAAAHVPDVILMDYHLPDGDGASAAARIRADHPSIKIVLLTGSDDPDALQRAVEAGCVGYLDKMRALDDLAAAVRVAATGHVVIAADNLSNIVSRRRDDAVSLTAREREILVLAAAGLTDRATAERLGLSVHTVRTHLQAILGKLGAHSKLEAVAIAKRHRLLE